MPKWLDEFSSVTDKRLLWDLIKYKVRQVTMKYSKEKARQRRKNISDIEASLRTCEERCNESPSAENQEQLEMLQMEYDSIYEEIEKRRHNSIKSYLV